MAFTSSLLVILAHFVNPEKHLLLMLMEDDNDLWQVVVYLGLLATMLCPSHFLPTLLPHSSSLAMYCSVQLALHLLTAAGSTMLAANVHPGLCLTNLTSFASFSLLSPLIYGSFLHNWFAANQPSLLFAYKAQLDDGEEEPSSIINMSRDEDDLEGSHGESLIVRPN